MRRGTKKTLEGAASNDKSAQRPIKQGTQAPDGFAALIGSITHENRHDLAGFGPPVGREFW